MTLLLSYQKDACHGAWGLRHVPAAQQRKRTSDEANCTSSPGKAVDAAVPARKRFTASVIRKYASELATFDSISVELSESDCPYL